MFRVLILWCNLLLYSIIKSWRKTLERYLLFQEEVCSWRHLKTEKLLTARTHSGALLFKSEEEETWRVFSLMPDQVLPVVQLLSYLPATSKIQCRLLLNSCFYILKNIIISSISLLFFSLHRLVYLVFSYRLVFIFSDCWSVLFPDLVFLHLAKGQKLCKSK